MNNSHVQQPLECNTSIIMKPSSLFCVERPAETHGFLRGAVSEHGLQSGPALHAEQPLVSCPQTTGELPKVPTCEIHSPVNHSYGLSARLSYNCNCFVSCVAAWQPTSCRRSCTVWAVGTLMWSRRLSGICQNTYFFVKVGEKKAVLSLSLFALQRSMAE